MPESTIARISSDASLEPAWETMTPQQAEQLALAINSLYPAWPVNAVWCALGSAVALHEGDSAATVALALFNFATDERNLDVGGFRFPGTWWDTARAHTAALSETNVSDAPDAA